MSQTVYAKITFDMPADPTEETATFATVAVAWKQFTDTVSATGVKVWGQSFEMKRTRGPNFRERPHIVRPGDAA